MSTRAYLVTDDDLYELAGYRGGVLVGECSRLPNGTWECRRVADAYAEVGHATDRVPAFLRCVCGATEVRAAASVCLPNLDDPSVIVAFRPTGTVPATVGLRKTLKYAGRQGLRCTAGAVP